MSQPVASSPGSVFWMNDSAERLLLEIPVPWPLSVHALLSSRSLTGSCTGSGVPATGSVPQPLLISPALRRCCRHQQDSPEVNYFEIAGAGQQPQLG